MTLSAKKEKDKDRRKSYRREQSETLVSNTPKVKPLRREKSTSTLVQPRRPFQLDNNKEEIDEEVEFADAGYDSSDELSEAVEEEEIDENDALSTHREMTPKELKDAFEDPKTIKDVLGLPCNRRSNHVLIPLLKIFADKGLIISNGTKGLTIRQLDVFRRCCGSVAPMKIPAIVAFLGNVLNQLEREQREE